MADEPKGFSWVNPNSSITRKKGRAAVQTVPQWMRGWQMPNSAEAAAIAQQFGPPQTDIQADEAFTGYPEVSPHVNPVAPVAPPATEGQSFIDPSSLQDVPVHPITGEPVAAPTLTDIRRQQFFAEGGTPHTLHRAQVAAGIRPAIDGRAPLSAHDAYANGSPSDNVRAGWGWVDRTQPDDGGDYKFDPAFGNRVQFMPAGPQTRRAANQQAEWNQRFDDARSRIYDSLGN